MFASTDNHKTNDRFDAAVENPFEVKKQPTRCRDPLFAVLFYANIAAIVVVASLYGSNPFTVQDNANVNGGATVDYTPFFYVAGISGGVGLVFSALALQVLMCIPGILIKAALLLNVVLSLVAAAVAFYYNSTGMAIFALVVFALTACWTYCIWSRIPFATVNLKTGTTATRANCGITFMAYIIVAVAIAWTLLWTVTVVGVQDQLVTCTTDENGVTVCENFNYLFIFLLFLSYFFTHQVLSNTIHTTVAGVVGSWWFVPSESGFCGKSVVGSFCRSVTTSFGSICFGSLIVAIIEALRQIVNMARDNDDLGAALACCIDCLLSCIEGLVEYFNRWAYIYVGLYGFGYCEAGKNVMGLFKDRGWEAIIADDIVGSVLGLVSLVVGLITAGTAVLTVNQSGWFDDIIVAFDNSTTQVYVVAGIIGFIIGIAICSIAMGVISSSVLAVIVCFAEAPYEFEENYPELSRDMREAYSSIHPGCFDRFPTRR